MARILIAASREPREVLKRILGEHQFICANTPNQALKLLRREDFDIIICTRLFDDSRMFEFLKLVKDEEAFERIPFLCAQVLQSSLTLPIAAEATRFAAEQLGAIGYLDIREFKKYPEEQLRRGIEAFLKPRASKQ